MMMITGANQGGKSTFLPSMGIAQLMMQVGLFVSGKQFRAGLVEGLLTHFKREEDTSMRGGKFDEQLSRISGLVDMPTPHAMALFNGSFASTRECKGSEIARQIVCAHLDSGIKVWLVTHLFVLACRLMDTRLDDALFLRAKRKEERARTFRLMEGHPSIRVAARTSSTRSLPTAPASAQGRCSRNEVAALTKGFVLEESCVLRATIAMFRLSISTSDPPPAIGWPGRGAGQVGARHASPPSCRCSAPAAGA